jgi:putative FmdB family regulatory protein
MPLYAFRCTRCGHEFDRLLSLKDDQHQVCCPACGHEVRRLVSTFSSPGSCGSGSVAAPGGG